MIFPRYLIFKIWVICCFLLEISYELSNATCRCYLHNIAHSCNHKIIIHDPILLFTYKLRYSDRLKIVTPTG